MSKFSIVLCLVLASCCVSSSGDDNDRIASAEEFDKATEHINWPVNAGDLLEAGMTVDEIIAAELTRAHFKTTSRTGTEEVCSVIVITHPPASTDDDWWTCAQIGNNQAFGISKIYGSVFFTEETKPCHRNKDYGVGSFWLIIPKKDLDRELAALTGPSHGSEQIQLTVAETDCSPLK